MDELPHWPEGTVAVLSTHGPHAIPVSLVMRAGPRELLVGLARRRDSLARLREHPRCAVTILAAGDHAFTAYGRATPQAEHGRLVAVRVEVDEIADHNRPTYAIDDGVQWRWTDDEARQADAESRASLRRAAEGAA